MARITFEVSDQFKQAIRIRLAREGHTFSDILRVFCSHYRDFGLYPVSQVYWEDRHRLPDLPGVFFIYTGEGNLQYIGQAESLRRQFVHLPRHNDQFAGPGTSILWVEVPVGALLDSGSLAEE